MIGKAALCPIDPFIHISINPSAIYPALRLLWPVVVGTIKNPRPFPAVGSCRNFTQRQAPTASLTTTSRLTCRILSNIAEESIGKIASGSSREFIHRQPFIGINVDFIVVLLKQKASEGKKPSCSARFPHKKPSPQQNESKGPPKYRRESLASFQPFVCYLGKRMLSSKHASDARIGCL